jgi:cardiolipin synthase
MDFRSFENNFEANVFVYGTSAAEGMRRLFLDDMACCDEIVYADWKKRPYYRRLLESTTRILGPLL